MRNSPSKTWLLPLLALAVSALGADRDEPKLAPAPPQPVPLNLKVPRVSNAEVVLKIYGRQREVLRFLIRARPESGKISELKPAGREAAVVFYEPPQDLAIKTDKFSYAVQNSMGVSAPADVNITILDEPARLIVPDTIAFEPLLAGTSARKEFTLANDGGSLAEGEVQVDAPWRIEGATAYRLGRGERQIFKLHFAPLTGGKVRREMRYTSHLDRVTTLLGEAEFPLSLAPTKLELQRGAGETVRTGSVEIANQTEAEQKVKVKASARLHAPESVAIPGHGKATVTFKTAPEDTGVIQEQVVFAGSGIEVRLPVEAPVVPAVLRAEVETLQLPPAIGGRGAGAKFLVRNRGGMPGFWRAEPAAPFVVSPMEVRLRPGEHAEIDVRLETVEPGQHRAAIRFAGELQTVQVSVEGEAAPGVAAAPSRGVLPRRAEAPQPASNEIEEAGPGLRSIEEIAELAGQARPGLPKIRVMELTPSSAVLEWPEAMTEAKPVRLDLQKLALDKNRNLQAEWLEHRDTRIKVRNGTVRAEIRNLPPGAIHFMRIAIVDKDTGTVRPLFTLNFGTPKAQPLVKVTPLRTLFAVALVCAGILIWQAYRRRPSSIM